MNPTKYWMWVALVFAAVFGIASSVSAQKPDDDYDDIDVIAAGRYPGVSWVSPPDGTTYFTPINASNKVLLVADALSRRSTISQVQFVYALNCPVGATCAETPLAAATLISGNNKSGRYQFDWTGIGVGNYKIRARASDAAGGVNFSSFFNVTVTNAPPVVTITSPPVAFGKTYALFQGPSASGIPFSATATDGDGLQANSLKLYQDGGQVGTSASSSPFSTTLATLSVGTYVLSATATDSLGATTTVTRTLKVNSPPQGSVSLNVPAGVNHVTVGSTLPVIIAAAPTDTDSGGIAQVEFLQDGVVVAGCTKTAAPYTCAVSLPARAAAYSLTARATDNDNGMTTYTAIAVTVNAKPVISAFSLWQGTTQLTPAPSNSSNYFFVGAQAANTLTLKPTADDSADGGSVVGYTFKKDGTTIPGCAAIAVASCPLPALAVRTAAYTLTVDATDNNGGVTSRSLNVTVWPTVVITAPVSDATVSAFPFAVAASASDSTSTITQVDFYSKLGTGTPQLIGSAAPTVTLGIWAASVTWQCPANTGATKYTIYAVLKDSAGGTADSPSVTNVSVNNTGLQNCSFEEPSLTTTPFSCIGAACTSAVWTFNANSGIVGNGAAATYCGSTNAAQGTQAGLLRGDPTTKGKVSQTINFPTSGTYRLDFRALRNAVAAQNLVVRVGNNLIDSIAIAVPVLGNPNTYPAVQSTATFPILTVGNALIEFETQGTAATQLMCIDDIRVVKVPSPPTASLAISGLIGPTAAQLNDVYYTTSQTAAVLTATVDDLDGGADISALTVVSRLNGIDTLVTDAPFSGTCARVNYPTKATLTCSNVQIAGRVDAYRFIAKATDSTSSTVLSPPVSVLVDRPPNVNTPTLSKATLRQGEAVNITFTPTELDGDSLSATASCSMAGNLNSVSVPVPATPPLASGVAKVIPWNVLSTQPVGSYTCTVTVSDGRLPQSAISAPSAAVSVTLNNGPTVTLTSPVANQTFAANASGALVTLTATVNNTDLDATQTVTFDWSPGANSTNWPPVSPYTTTPVLTSGTTTNGTWGATWLAQLSADTVYSFRACATDSYGIKTCTAGVNATVAKRLNFAPTISNAIVSTTATGSIKISVTASDPDVNTLTVSAPSAGSCSIVGSGSCDLTITSPTVGVNAVLVTVSDGLGGVVTTTVMVSASATPDAALKNPDTSVVADPATSTIGTTAGTFAVGEGGSASYSIPVQVAPGVNGLQPNLGLTYSSQGGNGYLGVGWSLSGFSSITRCPKTSATDGVKEGINYDSDPLNDAFCLDGQRLIVTAPRVDTGLRNVYTDSSGTGVTEVVWETEFRTEVDSYSRILAYQEWGFKGPTRFVVKSKSGQTAQYGSRYWLLSAGGFVLPNQDCTATAPGDQRCHVIKSWMLDQVTDSAGNQMTIDYEGTNLLAAQTFSGGVAMASRIAPGASNPPTEIYPTRITYGTNRVDLTYSARPEGDESRFFDSGGGETLLSKKLDSVSTYSDNQLVKSYVLDYLDGGTRSVSTVTNRLLLKAVKECDAANNCLPPTRFNWKGQTYGSPFKHSEFLSETLLTPFQAGDIVGNGRSALVKVNGAQQDAYIWRFNPASNSWQSATWTTVGGYTKSSFLLADSNGDSRVDWMQYRTDGTQGLQICRSTGAGLICTVNNNIPIPVEGFVLQGDFDGDGNIDFMFYRGNPTGVQFKFDVHWGIGGATGGLTTVGQPVTFDIAPGTTLLKASEQFIVSDFDGDGKSDVFYKQTSDNTYAVPDNLTAASNQWKVCFGKSRSTPFTCPSTWIAGPYEKANKLTTADFNGDGLADIAWPIYSNGQPGGYWYVCLSAGEGSFSRLPFAVNAVNNTVTSAPLCSIVAGPGGPNAILDKVLFGDFNGDGRTDIAMLASGTTVANGEWNIYFSKGSSNLLDTAQNANNGVQFDCTASQDGVGGCRSWSMSTPGSAPLTNVRTSDFLGVGKTSFLIENFGTRHYVLGFANDSDLLGSITTGLGATTNVEYAPLTDSSVYSRGADATGANELTIQTPMYVVKSTTATNGVGGNFATSYFYESLRGTTNGRGLIGFSKRRTTDSLGIVTEITYNNTLGASLSDWAIAGRPTRITKCAPTSNGLVADIRQTAEAAANTCSYAGYALVNRITSTWATRNSAMNYAGVVEAFGTGSKEESWELPTGTATVGTALPVNETTSSVADHDVHGNLLATTVVSGGGFTKTIANEYYPPDTRGSGTDSFRNWIVGRLKKSTVTHADGVTASVVRVSKFAYQGATGTSLPLENQGEASCNNAKPGFLCVEEAEPDFAAADNASRDLYLKTTYRYDTNGNRTDSTVWFYDRDINGVLASALSSRTTTVTFGYGGRFPIQVTNATGTQSELRNFDTRFGVVNLVVGPNGFATKTVFDRFGRKIRETGYSSSTGAAGSLAVSGDVISDATWTTSTAVPCGANGQYSILRAIAGGPSSMVVYDSLQREVCSRSMNFSDQWSVATTSYDSLGRKSAASKPVGSGTLTSMVFYDTLSRPICEYSTTATTALPTTCAAGTVSASAGTAAKATTTYDGLTTTATVYGANGGAGADKTLSTSRTKNSQGWVVQAVDASGVATTYEYNAIGNLTKVNAPGGYSEAFRYDRRGRKTGMDSPDAGNGWVYRYNGMGEMSEQVDARGQYTRTTYDVLGRVTQRGEYENGNATVFNTSTVYDSCAKGIGKVCSLSSGYDGTSRTKSTVGYDNLGRAVTSTATLDGRVFTSATSYDKYGRVSEQGAPGGVVLQSNYQATNGYALSVTQKDTGTIHWRADTRNADGGIATMTVGGLTTAKSYDGMGRITGISTGASGNVQASVFGFDAVGNLRTRTDTSNGIAAADFTYDALNRLTEWSVDFVSGNGSARYDAGGNLVWKTGATGCMGTASADTPCLLYVNGTHRLLNANGFTYAYEGGDAAGVGNGNVATISSGKSLSNYTAFNLPRNASSSTAQIDWLYDGGHSRVREVSSQHGTTYFLGGYERVERDRTTVALADSAVPYTGCLEERTYIATPEGTVGVVTRRTNCASNTAGALGDPSYWHKDHIGSIVATTNVAGNVTARFRFDPWGKRDCATLNLSTGAATGWFVCNATASEERGFTGHEMLDELGLVHMNGRLYDQSVGRFMQADPIVQDAYNPQNYNRYSYVVNNPLSFTDPSGFAFWDKKHRWLRMWAFGGAFYSKETARMAAAIAVGWALGPAGMFGPWLGGGFFQAAAAGFASGGISGGNIQSALQGAFSAGLFHGAGTIASGLDQAGIAGFGDGGIGRVALHVAAGCASGAAAGGSCGRSAASAGFSELIGGNFGQHVGGGDLGQLVFRAVIGGVASRIGGGKFENGAMTGAFGYLFNQMMHQRTHAYGVLMTRQLGPATDPLISEAANMSIHLWNAPGPVEMLGVGESRELMLWFGNPIRQTSQAPNVVINETLPGHILHGDDLGSGKVVRWVGVDPDGQVRIYTYGYGPNRNALWALANTPMGNILFGGLINQANENSTAVLYSYLKAGATIPWRK